MFDFPSHVFYTEGTKGHCKGYVNIDWTCVYEVTVSNRIIATFEKRIVYSLEINSLLASATILNLMFGYKAFSNSNLLLHKFARRN